MPPETEQCTEIILAPRQHAEHPTSAGAEPPQTPGGIPGRIPGVEEHRLLVWQRWKAAVADICSEATLKRLALSQREEQVVLGIMNDLEDKEIAAELRIAACTVRQHYNSAYDKLMPEVALENHQRKQAGELGGLKERRRIGLVVFVVRAGKKSAHTEKSK